MRGDTGRSADEAALAEVLAMSVAFTAALRVKEKKRPTRRKG
jgi:hypothetical protein